jgi:hypothetical protein
LDATWQVSEVLLGIEERTRDVRGRSPALLGSIQLFSVGSRQEALDALQSWLRNNVEDYVKIYDPYFSLADLSVLKGVPSDARVTILTSWEAQEGITFDDAAIADRYQSEWSRISDLRPPETHIYVLGIKTTGQSPMHDRYYVTAEGGIHLGTSRSGLGKRDSSITSLGTDEAATLEAERIDSLIVRPPLHFKGERLVVRAFTL